MTKKKVELSFDLPVASDDPYSDLDEYFPTPLQRFQFLDKYSRYRYDLGRRETWSETVDRAVDYMRWLSRDKLSEKDYKEIHHAILNLHVMPSMRLLAMAGEAAKRDSKSIFNCAALAIDSIESIVEVLSLSMAGVGIGFSVESRYTNQLPRIKRQSGTFSVFIIPDTTDGWCTALRVGLEAWYSGKDIVFDYSQIRKAGEPLRTKGGRASGSRPLKELLDFTRGRITSRGGTQLRPIDVYDIVDKIGDCVIQGGVRRVAFLSMFDIDDALMLNAKAGDFWKLQPWRYNSNNSVVIEREMSLDEVRALMLSMDASKNGEPGIISRVAIKNTMPDRRNKEHEFLVNGCAEVVLRGDPGGGQLCNLTSVVCRADDDVNMLAYKVRVATVIGTIQAMATDFNLRPQWSTNQREESLLGVDLNGQMDCAEVRKPEVQQFLKQHAIEVNEKYAKRLGVNPSAAITTVKPSGNSGVMLDISSGIHPRWSAYYIRNVRVSKTSPLYRVLKDSGVKMSPENGQNAETATTFVVGFPTKSPDGAITRHDMGAIEQLDYWKSVKLNWTEHNPSMTCYYNEDELEAVIQWVYDNQLVIGGLSFLPRFDMNYENAPYIEIDQETYERMVSEFPKIKWGLLAEYEKSDLSSSGQEVACSAGACEFKL